MASKAKRLPPIHAGEILREEFMAPLGLSMNSLALALRVPVTRVTEIVHERRAITPDTALRLARYFNTTPRFWVNLQAAYDLEIAEQELEQEIVRDVRPSPQATPVVHEGCRKEAKRFANRPSPVRLRRPISPTGKGRNASSGVASPAGRGLR